MKQAITYDKIVYLTKKGFAVNFQNFQNFVSRTGHLTFSCGLGKIRKLKKKWFVCQNNSINDTYL